MGYLILCYALYRLLRKNDLVSFVYLLLFARIINPVFFNETLVFTAFWWISLLFGLSASWLLGSRQPVSKTKLFGFLVYALSVVTSVIFSINPFLAFAKAFSWIVITLLFAVNASPDNAKSYKWIKNFFLLVLLTSVLTLPFPSISYQRDGLGFQGILDHPQSFAVFTAITINFIWKNLKRNQWILMLLCIILVYLSRARTGVLIMLAPFLFEVLKIIRYLFLLSFQKVISIFVRYRQLLLFAMLFLPVAYLLVPSGSFVDFVFKSRENQNLTEAYHDSRGFIAVEMTQNFLDYPTTGIGFGIAKSTTHEQTVKTIGGIPVGASTEKANILLAVLEETGLIGLLGAIIWSLTLINRRLSSNLIFPLILSNMSEVTIFSYGSFGILFGLFIAHSYAKR